MKYYVIDTYEGLELLGTTEDKKEAYRILNERIEDTDGECMVGILTEEQYNNFLN